MDQQRIPNDLIVDGDLSAGGTISFSEGLARDQLQLEDLVEFAVPLTDCRVHDALQTNLPGTSSSDDLALVGGTFGSASPSLQTYDVKTAGAVTLRARLQVKLPAEYVAGETVRLRLRAGMKTTVADTSCTLDVEAYESNKEAGVGSDLVTDAAQSINSLTFANKDFNINPSGLRAGDVLDVRITVAANDAAGATAVIACIGGITLLCDIKG